VLNTELNAANMLANNQLAQLMIAGGQTAMGYGLMAPTGGAPVPWTNPNTNQVTTFL